jgi:hypothetical protein
MQPAAQPPANPVFYHPYADETTNFIYNLLFCDDLQLFQSRMEPPYEYPFNVLFAAGGTPAALQQLIDDAHADARIKILACNKQRAGGHAPDKKELLAVIVEVGLEGGLDVLASFYNGTARYINKTGKVLVWETVGDAKATELTRTLFYNSAQIVNKIGPWDGVRKQHPPTGNTRISFLVSDGLYFGEAPTPVLFGDAMAGPALQCAVQLLQYITEKALP